MQGKMRESPGGVVGSMQLEPSWLAAEPRSARAMNFVGRSATIARMAATLQEARDGHGCVLLLRGDRGVGKTRTAEQLLQRGREAGVQVLTASCDRARCASPLSPFVDLLQQLAAG